MSIATSQMRSKCDPAMNKVMTDISDLTNEFQKLLDRASDNTQSITDRTIFNSYLIAAIGLIVACCYSLFIAIAGISRPLQAIVATLHRLSDGEMDIDIPGQGRRDEVGMIARAALHFRDESVEAIKIRQHATELAEADASRNLREYEIRKVAADNLSQVLKELEIALKQVSSGALTVKLPLGQDDAFAQLRTDFNFAIRQLALTIQAVISSVHVISNNSTELLSNSEDLARRAEHQAANLEETTAAIRELTGAVNETDSASNQTLTIIEKTKDDATKNLATVSEAQSAITRIHESSEKIASIVHIIDEIAFQTNLLALNAGVEEARAGDAGRGFAVVASEVRALAQRSASAAKDVKDLIANSIEEVSNGVRLVQMTGQAFDRIQDQIVKISNEISGISKRANHQSVTLHEISTAISEIDKTTQRTVTVADTTAAASRMLATECKQLAVNVAQFTIPTDEEDYDHGEHQIGRVA
jgi:methyl-accepting chemotaxis protein